MIANSFVTALVETELPGFLPTVLNRPIERGELIELPRSYKSPSAILWKVILTETYSSGLDQIQIGYIWPVDFLIPDRLVWDSWKGRDYDPGQTLSICVNRRFQYLTEIIHVNHKPGDRCRFPKVLEAFEPVREGETLMKGIPTDWTLDDAQAFNPTGDNPFYQAVNILLYQQAESLVAA